MFVCLGVGLLGCWGVGLFVCLCVGLFVCLGVGLFVCLGVGVCARGAVWVLCVEAGQQLVLRRAGGRDPAARLWSRV